MSILTPEQCVQAREVLGMSQSKVAREAGIPRPYISQFESGKRLLEDRLLSALKAFFIQAGWEPLGDIQPAVGECVVALGGKGSTFRDGFAIPDGLDPNEVEVLLAEYHDNTQQISDIRGRPLKREFIFGEIEEERAMDSAVELLLLGYRQAQIKQILHGQSPEADQVDLSDQSALRDIGDYVDSMMIKVLGPHNTEAVPVKVELEVENE